MCSRTVLIAEDEPLIRMVLAEVLIEEGYHVLEASTALEAIGALGKIENVDAVITDVDMPGGLSGIDLAKAVAAYSPRTPVLITSGRCGHLSLPEGSHEFLPKPYALEEVIDFLVRRLEQTPDLHEPMLRDGLLRTG